MTRSPREAKENNLRNLRISFSLHLKMREMTRIDKRKTSRNNYKQRH